MRNEEENGSTSAFRIRHSAFNTAWQGWRMHLPAKWSPVKLEGTYEEGHALFADLLRPRIGLRWQMPRGRKFNVDEWAHRAMVNEVGRLAAEEAQPFKMPGETWQGARLYVEPKPPGRDVWMGFSTVSRRAVQVTYHAHRRERILPESILPSLQDLPVTEPMPWAVFDLSCVVPAGWSLEKHRLHAGDLSLSFRKARDRLTVRQVAVAGLALQRMPLDKWLLDQQRGDRKHYRPTGVLTDARVEVGPASLEARHGTMRRRKRFFMVRSMPPEQLTLAMHDKERDKLLIAQGSDETALKDVLRTVGQE